MRKYLPMLFVELYLFFTLILFYFGPIEYRLASPILFLILMVMYHCFFVFGYILACKLKPLNKFEVSSWRYSGVSYWLLFIFGLIGVWISYKNIMGLEEFIPYDFFSNLIRGFLEPGLVYSERMLNLHEGNASGSRFFNIVSIFFAFSKLLFVFYFMYFWSYLKFFKKFLALIYSLFFISVGISAGVNSVVFIFFIFSAISLLVILYERKYKYFWRAIGLSVLLFILPLTWFGSVMSERGGGFDYFSSTSPLGDIAVVSSFELTDDSSFFEFLYYSFVWLSYYVCQGYYGFSLILDMDWMWTYGFGNSEFIQRQLFMIGGVDVSSLTFQSRIDHVWDRSAQWHSFYGQFANDVGFVGLSLLMFVIGFFFARVWMTVLYKKNFYGLALMPIFVIMFIFFPANNQVFAYIDTLSYFAVVTFLWFFKSRKTMGMNHV